MSIIRYFSLSQTINFCFKKGIILNHLSHPILKTTAITIRYEVTPKMITYAYAICSENDQFSRPIGRQLTDERLAANPITLPPETVNRLFSIEALAAGTVDFTMLNPQVYADYILQAILTAK